jgi:hypothetical protein
LLEKPLFSGGKTHAIVSAGCPFFQEFPDGYFHKAKSLEAMGRAGDAVQALRAGEAAARGAGDGHALAEISGYLDELTP